jgi:hypothetical protein
VHPEKRKAGIAPQVIQTHEYNQRHANKQIKVSLFKREGTLTGIVPLTVYKTYGYFCPSYVFQSKIDEDPRYSVVQVNYKHMESFYDFMKENESKFDLVIQPHIGNMVELVKTGNIFIYMHIDESQEVTGLYFFRETCTQIVYTKKDNTKTDEKETSSVTIVNCFASIMHKENPDVELFVDGFNKSLCHLQKTHPTYQYVTIEDCADNHRLLKSWNHSDDLRVDSVTPCAFFFYNFAYPSYASNRVLIL